MVLRKVLRDLAEGRRGRITVPFILQPSNSFSQTRKPVIISLNSVLFRLPVMAPKKDRVIDYSNKK